MKLLKTASLRTLNKSLSTDLLYRSFVDGKAYHLGTLVWIEVFCDRSELDYKYYLKYLF